MKLKLPASTKFWTIIIAMICVTGIELMLISKGIYNYLEWYFGFMITACGGFNILKHNQNITLARIINGNGNGVEK